MLKLLFDALDRHPWSYWVTVAVPTVALLGLIFPGGWLKQGPRNEKLGDRLFSAVVVLFVIAWRWPFFFETHEFNPDESQLIAGAATLAHDPVFWRSVDGTTSGPLNFFALLPLHFLGLPLDYFSARLTSSLLAGIALVSCYQLFRSFAPASAARLALLPAILFFGTTTDGNFLHYSSEQVSVALMGLASLGLLRKTNDERTAGRGTILGAVAAGLLPWAKLQTVPLGFALLVFKVWMIHADASRSRTARWRATTGLILWAAVPSAAALLAIVMTGQMDHFVRNYLLQNFLYVGGGSSLAATVKELAGFLVNTHAVIDYFAVSACLVLLTGIVFWRGRTRPGAYYIFGAIHTAVAVFCVLAPRRPYPHYLILCVLPLTFWAGTAICQLWPLVARRRALAIGTLAVICLVPLALRLSRPAPVIFGRFAEAWRRPYSLAGTILRAHTEPGEFLGVWGWRNDLYVDSGLIQATRDPHTVWLMNDTPIREYHRARYLSDLKRNRPDFFVDAVGPGAFSYYDRAVHGHEIFPDLAAYIRDNYRLLVDLGVERLYARKDSPRLTEIRMTASRLHEYDARSRKRSIVEAPAPERVEPAGLTGWDIDGEGVRSLHVPAKMVWPLSGREWQIILEYGLHPRAYTEGKSNGADLVIELEAEGHPPRQVFRRRLDPVREPRDRGQQTTVLTLPPHSWGTRLVVRSEAGDFNDAAWDWVYVRRLQYQRSPAFTAQQFPRFHRLPDQVDLPHSHLRNENGGPALVINAPGSLTYFLEPNETRLQFVHGYQPSPEAASDESKPYTITVQLNRTGKPAVTLLQRTLDPGTVMADRERRTVELAIPNPHSGDTLVLRIDQEGAAKSESIYLTDVALD